MYGVIKLTDKFMTNLEPQKPPNYFRIAWQSALAAALCLGLPAGLLLWLILFREIGHSVVIEQSVTLLQANGLVFPLFLVVFGVQLPNKFSEYLVF